eukprot:CAMPEP_0201593128 /NCGR_PEP_ID=MMETSP0190_2-20130828/190840_1 /ASSEMBLY_ACC=CAM_ASM_000263 /TAXON_ID=37353 /ORGANISM="Rosalina sp." /LENGTH=203 /DNA_ID=CAMNT_0048052221 /DNA_START=170 /DNA_END=780 /DNA_ORIENTATION=-
MDYHKNIYHGYLLDHHNQNNHEQEMVNVHVDQVKDLDDVVKRVKKHKEMESNNNNKSNKDKDKKKSASYGSIPYDDRRLDQMDMNQELEKVISNLEQEIGDKGIVRKKKISMMVELNELKTQRLKLRAESGPKGITDETKEKENKDKDGIIEDMKKKMVKMERNLKRLRIENKKLKQEKLKINKLSINKDMDWSGDNGGEIED